MFPKNSNGAVWVNSRNYTDTFITKWTLLFANIYIYHLCALCGYAENCEEGWKMQLASVTNF